VGELVEKVTKDGITTWKHYVEAPTGTATVYLRRSDGTVDSHSKLFHTVLLSAANVADRDALPHLLHGRETRVWGGQGYQGQTEVIRRRAPAAQDCTNCRYRRGGWIDETIKVTNREKSRVRAKVEHSIGVVRRVFGFQKVRYRGLAKNLRNLEVTAALANLFMVRRQLLRLLG
jgi:IS5 family transposase